MFSAKNYVMASSLNEAWELNQKKRNRILGGMLWLKMENIMLDTVIDLSALGLDTIEETEDEFLIGAMVTLRMLETHEGLNTFTDGAVRSAVRHIVGVQFRNLATVGGSIFGRFGFSDVLTVFMAMDCSVELFKGGIIPIAEFAKMTSDNDILVRLRVKKENARFVYKSVRNSKTDFPVLALALADTCGKIRVAVGARPAKAALITAENVTDADALGGLISQNFTFGTNMRGSAEYRAHLARVLAKRAFNETGGAK